MNVKLALAASAAVALIAFGALTSRPVRSSPRPAETAFAIRNVRVFDGDTTIAGTSVVVKDGIIASVGGDIPDGIRVIDGAGKTLIPGLIDAHTHAFGDALDRALAFGVTTELDMFTDRRFAASMRSEQEQADGALTRADLFSAGTLVTAPGGHGTEYGIRIPTLTRAADAAAFVDARIAEGSDYIKLVYDDGASYGLKLPTIDKDVLKAAIAAARTRDRLALVHIGSRSAAVDAIDAGASGLIHLFADSPVDEAFVARVKQSGAFVTPTLTVIHSTAGTGGSAPLLDDERITSFLTPPERTALGAAFPARPGSRVNPAYALAGVKRLYEADVPLLAGTDAPNPGTAHGASMHRELDLLVQAGLSPADALAAATSVPARVFDLGDRGRIAPGKRADLVLVDGDPTKDITATRAIVSIWKRGVRLESRAAPVETAATMETGTGLVSTFDDGEANAAFGAGWHVSTDERMGGASEATMGIVAPGANGTRSALRITGTMSAGAPYPWAGAIFFPAPQPMTPADLSRFKEIVFWARGDGAEYRLMVFATRLGQIPAIYTFRADATWRELVVPFSALSGIDGSDVSGIMFSAGANTGKFEFAIDEVRFR